MKKYRTFLFMLPILIVSPLFAGEADVIDVQVYKNENNTYNFEVTVAHTDRGWEHYVDKWEILDEKDSIIATRVLLHPHENEQPFTRGLFGIDVPADNKWVKIRAYDSVHGYGGKTIKVTLP